MATALLFSRPKSLDSSLTHHFPSHQNICPANLWGLPIKYTQKLNTSRHAHCSTLILVPIISLVNSNSQAVALISRYTVCSNLKSPASAERYQTSPSYDGHRSKSSKTTGKYFKCLHLSLVLYPVDQRKSFGQI